MECVKPDAEIPLKGQPYLLSYDIQGGKTYAFEVRCVLEEGPVPKGALAAVEFFDASGAAIPGPYRGCSFSDRFGCFQYLPTEQWSSTEDTIAIQLIAPAHAVRVGLGLVRWQSKTIRIKSECRLVEAAPPKAVEPASSETKPQGEATLPPPAAEVRVLSEDGAPGYQSFELSGDPLWFERRVDALAECALLVACTATGSRRPKGALVRVSFVDADGAPIPGPYEHCVTSPKHGEFQYVAVNPRGPRLVYECIRLTAPPGATRVRLGFRAWGKELSAQLAPSWSLERWPLRIELSAQSIVQRRCRISPAWQYVIQGRCLARKEVERAALVTVRYYDASGTPIDAKPAGGLRFSGEFGLFSYIGGSPSSARSAFAVKLSPPESSTYACIGVTLWNAGVHCTLESKLELIEERLVQGAVSEDILLEQASAAAGATPERVEACVRELVASDPGNVDALAVLLKVCKAMGRIEEAYSVAQRIAAVARTPETVRQCEHARGVLAELDPSWAPRLGGPLEHYAPPDVCKPLHLFKVDQRFEASGAATRNHSTVAAQATAGLQPVVVTPLQYPRSSGAFEFKQFEEIDGVRYYCLDAGQYVQLTELPMDRRLEFGVLALAGVVRTERPTLIHAASGVRGYELALSGLSLREHFGIPLVYEVRSLHEHTWGPASLRTELSEYTVARMRQENRCMREADFVVTISNQMRDALVNRGIPVDRIQVVPNAVDPKRFHPSPPDAELRSKLGLDRKLVLGYVSNMSKREGHWVLVRALRALVDRGNDAGLLLVGDGPERRALEQLAYELGLRDRVVFTGNVSHTIVNRYYSIIDVFVVPRLRDLASDLVTPLKPFEAMAMGKTMLVSDRPALCEIIEPGVRGLAFETGSPGSLANQAEVLLGNRQLAERLAEEGRRWVVQNRTWDRNALAYKEIYDRVLARFGASRAPGRSTRTAEAAGRFA